MEDEFTSEKFKEALDKECKKLFGPNMAAEQENMIKELAENLTK